MINSIQAWRPKALLQLIKEKQFSGKVQVVFTEQDLQMQTITHPNIAVANVVGLGKLMVGQPEPVATVLVVGEKDDKPLSVSELTQKLALFTADNQPLAVTFHRGNGLGAVLITGIVAGVDHQARPVLYISTYTAEKHQFLDHAGHLLNHYMDLPVQ